MTQMPTPTSILRDIWSHPANSDARVKAVLRSVSWQCWKRLTRKPTTIDFHGLRLKCYPDSHSASTALYFNGMADFREMSFLNDYLRPGDNFVDVGANIGVYTLAAASLVGPSGHVDAFEPADIPASRLEANVRINGLDNVIEELSAMQYDTMIYDPETKTLAPTQRPWNIPVYNVLAVHRDRYIQITDRIVGAA